jgi:hypothetical protein
MDAFRDIYWVLRNKRGNQTGTCGRGNVGSLTRVMAPVTEKQPDRYEYATELLKRRFRQSIKD